MPSPERLIAGLTDALRDVHDVDRACWAAVDVLRDCGFDLASLYLERGDRLRCVGVRGYGQLYDGIPPGVGVIGSTFTSGRAAHVAVDSAPEGYRPAAGGVVEELCLPLTVDGRCIGALNVESTTRLPPEVVAMLAVVAEHLSAQLERLGGPPPESRSQRLVRYATELADASTLRELVGTLLDAAIAMSAMSSACLVGRQPRILAARGGSAGALTALRGEELRLLLPWVERGGSSRTSGEAGAMASPAQRLLQQAGLATFVLVPVTAGTESLGVLVVGDRNAQTVDPDTVESVELLAALAAADIRSLRSANQLRHQARTDHLTGLPHRRAFTEALELALLRDFSTSRGHLVVILMDLDGFKSVNDTHGHQAGDELLCRTAQVLCGALRSTDRLYRLGGDEFATLLEVEDVGELAVVAERLLSAARSAGTTVSIGACLVRPGEELHEAVADADTQLYDAKRAGRDRFCVRA